MTTSTQGQMVSGTLVFSGTGNLKVIEYPLNSSIRAYCQSMNGWGDPKNSMLLVNGVEVSQEYRLQAGDEIAISPRNSKNAS